ncbi:MAG: hypothetical protein QOH16_2623 [Gaiellaceae bacterium]|nr:hypothetical protein [Gaiellaceae bacterium]
MRSRAWVRQDLIAEIRRDLWRYLTPAADIETELLEASALLQLRPQELRTLGRLQFLVSEEVGRLLQQLPLLVRRLATTTASEEEWSAERVRGAIQWGRTIGVRQATGIPNLFVTSPARRAYQTPENELLALVLDAVVGLGKQTGWHRSASANVGRLVSDRVSEAERWLTTRSLLEVERRPMTPTKLARIRSGRHQRRYQPVLDAYERYRLLAEHLDRKAVQEAIETYGIITRDDATLFELVATFRIIEALRELGWRLSRLGLFEGALRMSGRKGSTELELTYQATPKDLSRGSVYRDVQRHHQLTPGALRPDLVIRLRRREEERWLLIEVKGGQRSGADSARAAAYDLLAYRTAFAPVLSNQVARPYGLGIAWGSDLRPNLASEIVLCTPDAIREALRELVA